MKRPGILWMTAGWIFYGFSFFLPALHAPGGLVTDLDGWQAAAFGLVCVTPDAFHSMPLYLSVELFLQTLTNLVMLFSPVTVFRPPYRLRAIYPHIMLTCCVLNIPWWA
ncbi:MAG TPA: hypothetical protein VFT43_13530, partial [Candidatus Polarisedimenticolia bacterium]|nr:hypothetical protein [Candidatus Polarisedimenticolia bacterium]